jgi:hypothetical protein
MLNHTDGVRRSRTSDDVLMSAPEEIRTPNLLIRRLIHTVCWRLGASVESASRRPESSSDLRGFVRVGGGESAGVRWRLGGEFWMSCDNVVTLSAPARPWRQRPRSPPGDSRQWESRRWFRPCCARNRSHGQPHARCRTAPRACPSPRYRPNTLCAVFANRDGTSRAHPRDVAVPQLAERDAA